VRRLATFWVLRAAGDEPVSQNSTACEPPRPAPRGACRATCQIRSTCLVADRTEESVAALESSSDDPVAIGALG